MDRDWGSKPGSGGVASATQANVQRRERLRALALENIDLSKDPYFMKNHLGQYECKLCLTVHTTEGSYLSHTQGKRHQEGLAKRAALLAKEKGSVPQAPTEEKKIVPKKRVATMGKPGYKIVKQKDRKTNQKCLLFQLYYPHILEGLRPRYRFMSTYEQKKEPIDKNFQYLLFAADPYDIIGFKIPAKEIDRSAGKFLTHWDEESNTFTMQFYYVADEKPKVDGYVEDADDDDDDDE